MLDRIKTLIECHIQRALTTNLTIAPELMLKMYPTLLDVLTRTSVPIGRCYTAVEMDHPNRIRFVLNRRSQLITPSAMKEWIKGMVLPGSPCAGDRQTECWCISRTATKRRVKPRVSILVTDKTGWQASDTLKELATEGVESTYILRYKRLDEKQWNGDINEFEKAVKKLYQNRPRTLAKRVPRETELAHSSPNEMNKAIREPEDDQGLEGDAGSGLWGKLYGVYKKL